MFSRMSTHAHDCKLYAHTYVSFSKHGGLRRSIPNCVHLSSCTGKLQPSRQSRAGTVSRTRHQVATQKPRADSKYKCPIRQERKLTRSRPFIKAALKIASGLNSSSLTSSRCTQSITKPHEAALAQKMQGHAKPRWQLQRVPDRVT